MEADTQKLEEAGLIKPGWQQRLPNNSVPTNSTVSVLVRAGNPMKLPSWDDLAKADIHVVAAKPGASGGARWNFIALWGAITENGGDESKAKEFISSVYKNADALPKDAREATDFFVTRKQGDVLLNWETEGILATNKGEWKEPILLLGPNVLTEMPIAVVDKNVDKKGTRKAAEAFAEFLYTPFAQQVFASNGFRPVTPEGKDYAKGKFKEVKFFTIDDFGGWKKASKKFFADGGIWDQIFSQTRS
jgi:sulfate transport system substrate-binding protein